MVKRTVNHDLTFKEQLTNLVLGINGELAEVSKAVKKLKYSEALDEIGDVCWYVANLCTLLEWDFEDFIPKPVHITIMSSYMIRANLQEAQEAGGTIADLVKKYCYQYHQMDKDKFKKPLIMIIAAMNQYLRNYGFTFEQAFDINQDKLLARYPDGFEAEKSINREV